MGLLRKFFGRFFVLLLATLLPLFMVTAEELAPLQGGALNFQGFLVDTEGVPFGTETPTNFCMKFSILSADPDFIGWESSTLLVLVDKGLFSVRLGKFDQDTQPLDDRVFTGSDRTGNKRFLHIEILPESGRTICPPYRPENYLSFSKREVDGRSITPDLPAGNLDSEISIPGVPFSVSALRIKGNDVKEGTLRISRDPGDTNALENDLQILATGAYDGLSIIQNKNLGLIIHQTDPARPDALVTENGNAIIRGSLFVSGEDSELNIEGTLESVNATSGGTLTLLGKRLGFNTVEVTAGDIRSPTYQNPISKDFEASVTGESRLHKLRIVDINNDVGKGTLEVRVQSSGSTQAIVRKDGNVEISDQGFLTLQAKNSKLLTLSDPESEIQALGFYDNEQTSTSLSSSYPYQMIPHGLSILNTITLGESRQFSTVRLKGLIGEFTNVQGVFDFKNPNIYRDARTGTGLHTHDLRVGADPGGLIEKLNNRSSSTLIVKRRVDTRLAYLFENNDGLTQDRPFFFEKLNIFNHFENSAFDLANPFVNPSVFTNDRIVVGHTFDEQQQKHFGVFLGGLENPDRILLGTNYENLNDLYFLHCGALRDCDLTVNALTDSVVLNPLPLLKLKAANASLEGSLLLTSTIHTASEPDLVIGTDSEDSFALLRGGNIYLKGNAYRDGDGTYLADNFSEYGLKDSFGIGFSSKPSDNPLLHMIFGVTTLGGDFVLSRSPILQTSLTLSGNAFSSFLCDQDDSPPLCEFGKDHYMDPSGTSRLSSLNVRGNLTAELDLSTGDITSAKKVLVDGSATFSSSLSAGFFFDSDSTISPIGLDPDDSTAYLINPNPINAPPTRLHELEAKGNLKLTEEASIGGDLSSTSDLNSQRNMVLNPGEFRSDGRIRTPDFSDIDDSNYGLTFNNDSTWKSLSLQGKLTASKLNSISDSKTMTIDGGLQAGALDVFGFVQTQKFIDSNSSGYVLDPHANTTFSSLDAGTLLGEKMLVQDDAQLYLSAVASSRVSIGKSLVSSSYLRHFGEIKIQPVTATLPTFHVNTQGDILEAHRMFLTEGLTLTSKDSVALIFAGISQQSEEGSNVLSFTTAYADLRLLHSSMDISQGKFLLQSDGAIRSQGSLTLKTSLITGHLGVESIIQTTGSALLFDSSTGTFNLQNISLGTPLNLVLNSANIHRTLTSSNLLEAPYVIHPGGIFRLDPNSQTRLHVLTVSKKQGLGGGMLSKGPIHFSSWRDSDLTTLSIDPSSFTTLSRLQTRVSTFTSGLLLDPSFNQDGPLLEIRSNIDSKNLLALDSEVFTYSRTGLLKTSANFHLTSDVFLESTDGLVFTSDTGSIDEVKITSQVLYLLAGKQNQLADVLHQHSVVQGRPLTDILRRDIDNSLSETNTFIASKEAVLIQPWQSTNSKVLRQVQADGTEVISISPDGVISAVRLRGDGTFLTGIGGDDLIDASISAEDIQTRGLNSASLALLTVGSDKVRQRILRANHLISGSLIDEHILSRTLGKEHLKTNSIDGTRFQSESIEGRHLARHSVSGDLISSQTMDTRKFANESIATEHIQLNTLSDRVFGDQQIRTHHIIPGSINSSRITTLSLKEIDLGSGSVGTEEIIDGSIESRAVETRAVVTQLIASNSVSAEKILSGSLLHQDVVTAAIILELVKPLSITSREVLDYTLVNSDFQDLSITREKLKNDAIRTGHLQTSSLNSHHLFTSQVLREHLSFTTIGSSEIKDYSVHNEDFLSNTINPSNLSAKSLETRHFLEAAVTRQKVSTTGLSQSRFRPFLIGTSQVTDSVVTRAHLAQGSILSIHVKNGSLQTQDLRDGDLEGEKIEDYAVLTENLEDFGIDSSNITTGAVLSGHFIDDSLESIDISTNTLTTDRFQDFSVLSSHIITLSLESGHFSTSAATRGKFKNDSVDVERIQSFTLVLSNFALKAVTEGKIKDDTFEQSRFALQTLSNADIGLRQILSSQIKSLAITEEKILTHTLNSRVLGSQLITLVKIAPATLLTTHFADESVNSNSVGTSELDHRVFEDSAILATHIATDTISTRSLASETITSLAIKPFSLTSRAVGTNQIQEFKVRGRSLKTQNLAFESITGSLIETESLTTRAILSHSILAEHIASGAITSSKLKLSIVTSGNIVDGSILSGHLTTSFAETRHFLDNSVTSYAIASLVIESSHLVDDTLGSEKIKDDSVRNYMIQTRQVTGSKLKGPFPPSLFATRSISGDVLMDSSIESDRIASSTLRGVHLLDESILASMLKTNILQSLHFEDSSVVTSKILSQEVENRHLANGIIESPHVVDGSLQTTDVVTRTIPGSKIAEGEVRTSNILNGSLKGRTIANYSLFGNLFGSASLDGSVLSTAIVITELIEPRTLSGDRLDETTVKSSNFDSNFFLESGALGADVFGSDHISSQVLEARHFSNLSVSGTQISSIRGKDFQVHSIGSDYIQNGAVEGDNILDRTLGEEDHAVIYLRSSSVLSRTGQKAATQTFWTTGSSISDTTLDLEPGSADEFTFTSGTKLYRALLSSGGSQQLVTDFTPSTILDLDWFDSQNVYVVLQQGTNEAEIVEHNLSSGARTVHATGIEQFHRLSANQILGVDSSGNLLYSTAITFTNPTTVVLALNAGIHREPNLSPNQDYAFATRILPNGTDQIVRFPWNGSTKFGEPEDLTQYFTNQTLSVSTLLVEENLGTPELYFMGSIPDSASKLLYKISARGVGLTSYSISSPSGPLLVFDYDRYNPYVPDNTLTSSLVVNRSIDGNRLLDSTITRDDFVDNAADENLFQHQSLKNEDFADNSLTLEKWEQRTIENQKISTDSFSSVKVVDGSLTNRVFAQESLTGRVFEGSAFSTAQLISRTLTNEVLREESFGSNVLGSGISSDDLAHGSLLSEHFQNLTSASIADDSISAKKIKTNIIGDEHFVSATLLGEDIALESLPGSIFKTNQFEGNLIEVDAMNSSKIETGSLDSTVLGTHAVLTQNIADASLESRHFAVAAFLSTHLPTDVVTSQTLSDASVSSRSIATDSISSAQFQTDSITSESIANSTIGSGPLADSIFTGSHFASDSITHSDWISDTSLRLDQLAFSTLAESKLSDSVSLTTSKFRSGSFEGTVSNLGSSKILDREVLPEHFELYTLSTSKIADNAVETSHLGTATLQERHFSPDSIDEDSFLDSSIQDAHFISGTLTDSLILANTIDNSHFKADSIAAVKIKSGSLVNNLLPDRALSASKFTSFSILAEDFSTGSVHTTNIFDGNLTGPRVQSGSLSGTILKLLTLESADFGNEAVTSGNIQTETITARELKNLGLATRVFENASFTSDKLFYNADDTVLLIHSDAVDSSVLVTDSSNSQHNVSAAGGSHHEVDQVKFFSTSIAFNGTSDYLEIPDSDDFTMGTSDFTIDLWVYELGGSGAGNRSIMSNELVTADKLKIQIKDDQTVKFEVKIGNVERCSLISTSTLATNQWVHLSIARTGGTVTMYFNGTSVGTDTTVGSFDDVSMNMFFGKKANSVTEFFNGYMDEIRVIKGTAFWTSDFIPPSLPYQGIQEDKLTSNILTAAVLDGGITSDEIGLSTLTDDEVADGAIDSSFIRDGTFDGSKFSSGSVDGSKIKSLSLSSSNFETNAVATVDFNASLDITGKVASGAGIASDKISNGAVTGAKILTAFVAADQSVIANAILTDGKLSPSIQFTSAHVIDGSLDSTHLASDTLSAFAAGSLTSGKFFSGSGGISSKITDGSISDIHLQTSAVDSTKVTGILANSALLNSTLENADFEVGGLSNSEIETGSITTTQLTAVAWLSDSSTHFPTFSASQIQTLTGGQIEDDIFNSNHFSSGFFQAIHLDQIQAANFQQDTIGGSKISTLSLGAAQFVSEVLLTEQLALSTLNNSKVASGSVTAGHLQTESIQAQHFQTKSIGYSNLNTSSLDGLFSSTDVDPSFHMHSSYTFRRTTPTNFTLLHDDRYGRTQFAYALKSSTQLTSAQQQCSSDKAQVCDVNQIIDICRSGVNLNDDFYFSGDPSYVSTAGKEYFIAPMLSFTSSTCFTPTSIEWDFSLERFAPVHINDTTQGEIQDISYFKDKYVVKMKNRVYVTEDGYAAESDSAVSTAARTGAPLVYSPVSNNLYTQGSNKIYILNNALTANTQSSDSYPTLTDIDYFDTVSSYGLAGYNDSAAGNGSWHLAMVDSSGDNFSSLELGKHRKIRGVQTRISSGGIQDGFSLNYVDEAWSELLSNDSSPDSDQFSRRSFSVGLGFDNKIWIFGGQDSGGELNDTWSSTTGGSWTNVLTNSSTPGASQFPQRYRHAGTVYDGKMWIIGGKGSNYLNDIWNSTDGSSWTSALNPVEQYTRLLIHSSSGDGSTVITDASSSSHTITVSGDVHHEADQEKFGVSSIQFDGQDYWEEVTSSASWVERYEHGFLNYDSKLWVMGGDSSGGKRNGVYSSSDGSQWTAVLSDSGTPGVNQWSRRATFGTTTFEGKMWVIGGSDANNDLLNDVWFSTTGASWTEVSTPHEQYTRLLIHSDSADGHATVTDSSNSSHVISLHGDVHHETDQEKFGSSSLEFDGKDFWTKHTDSAPWGELYAHESLVFNSNLWVLGGKSTGQKNFVYSTTEGANWTEVLADTNSPSSSQWSQRSFHAATVFESEMWVLGGYDGDDRLNDIWHSTDGSSWTSVSNPTELYTKLLIHSSSTDGSTVVTDASSSSHSISTNGEVHHETDQEKFGISSLEFDGEDLWVETTASASWAGRSGHRVLAYNSKLWTMGGTKTGSNRVNDVYSSTDGESWTQVLADNSNEGSNQWSQRSNIAATVFSSEMWMIGGLEQGGALSNEVWHSTNGSSWTEVANPHEQYTRLLLHSDAADGNKTFTDSSIRSRAVSLGGDVHHETDQEKFGSSSIKFDGTDNWTELTSSAAFSARTGHQVVELSNTLYLTGGQDSSGLTSDIYSSTDGSNWSEKDTSDSNTVLLIHSDNSDNSTSFEDSSNSGHTINIPTGSNVHHDTSPSLLGNSAIAFDGVGDFLSVPPSSDFSFGTGDFTFELWAYIDNLSNPVAGYSGFIGMQINGNNRWYFAVSNGGSLKFYVKQGIERMDLNWTNTNIKEDGWYHIALVRNGNNFTAYVNGTSAGSITENGSVPDFSGGTGGQPPLEIGRRRSSGTIDYFKGSIDELRITKGSARYTSDFDAPDGRFRQWEARSGHTMITGGTKISVAGGYNGRNLTNEIWTSSDGANWDELQWRTNLLIHSDTTNGSTTFNDSSDSRNNPVRTLTPSGQVAHSTAQKKFGDSSIFFDGNADYISTETSGEFIFADRNLTIDAWIRLSSLGNYRAICGTWLNSSNRWYLAVDSDGDVFLHGVSGGSVLLDGSSNLKWTNANLSTNTWYHIALVREGSDFELFINGNSKGTKTDASEFPTITDYGLEIGMGRSGSFLEYFHGYMDEFRVSAGVARWTSNFTPPTNPHQRFSARRDFAAYKTSTTYYVAGGKDSSGNAIQDLWSSTDGIHWEEHTAPDWSARYGHETIVQSSGGTDTVYIFGGNTGSLDLNDVWKTTDGSTWTQQTSDAGWSDRSFLEVVEFNDKLWVLGGDASGTIKKDIWYSSTGASWIETEFEGEWDERSLHQAVVLNSQVHIIGGVDDSGATPTLYNDVWKSELSTDFLKLADSSDFAINNGDYTVDFWFYLTQTGTQMTLLQQYEDSNNYLTIEITSAGSLSLTYKLGGATKTSHSVSISANQWNHVGWVREGTSSRLYLNGSLASSGSPSGSFGDLSAPIYFGSDFEGNKILDGYLDEVRISQGIARWDSNFTPRTRRYETFLEPRYSHDAIVFDDSLYVMGGTTGGLSLSNVWSTSDSTGTSWTDLGDAPWSGRLNFGTSVFSDGSDKLWVFGGSTSTGIKNDVWSTTDGANWVQESASASWGTRYSHQVLTYDDKLYLLGGFASSENVNDVWVSSNGTTWTQTTRPAQWTERRDHRASVFNGKLWVLGGFSTDYQNDVWSSDLDETKIDFLELPDSDDFSPGTSNWTLDFWIYDKEGSGAGERYALNQYTNTSKFWDVKINNDQTVKLEYQAVSQVVSLSTTTTLATSQWVHLAFVRDGSTLTAYMDGVNSGTASVSDSFTNLVANLFLGAHSEGKGVLNGYLDEIRLSNGIARWSQNFTPPTKQYKTFWDPLRYHSVITFNGRMWLLGGQDENGRLNDVWSTDDDAGAGWVYHGEAGWSARRSHQAVGFSNKLWVMGGYDGGRKNDVWSSSDGVHWTKEGDADWSGREFFSATTLGGKLRVLGGVSANGRQNDLWSSSDGATWTSSTLPSPWESRSDSRVEVFNSKAYLTGGRSSTDSFSDVYSSDLEDQDVDFLQIADSTDFTPSTTDFTLDFWIYNSESPGNGVRSILAQTVDTNSFHSLQILPDNTLLSTYKNSGTTKVSLSSSSLVTANQWVHVALVRSGSNLKFYFDGKQAGSSTVQGGGDLQDLAADFYLGGDHTGSEIFDGYIDEVRLSKGRARWEESFTPRTRKYETFLEPKVGHEAIVFAGKLYILGGYNGTVNRSSVWVTADSNGVLWTDLDDAPWQARYLSASAVFSDGTEKMWIFGGSHSEGSINNTWSTTDGENWVSANDSPEWSARHSHKVVSYQNKLYLMGGTTGTHQNDIWSSSDGVNWTQTTIPTPWEIRREHGLTLFNDRVWLSGGTDGTNFYNDVWSSDLDESKVDFLQAADSNDWTLGSSDFTLDFWIRDQEGSGSGVRYIFNQSVDNENLHTLEILDDNTLRTTFKNGGVAKVSLDSSKSLTANQWIHVALVRSGTSMKFYFDGSESGSGSTQNGSNLFDLAADLYLGTSEDGSKILSGYLDEFRVSNGIARWTENFTPPTRSYDTFFRARERHKVAALGGRLYVIGGHDGSNYLNDVWSTSDSGGVNWTDHGDAAFSARRSFGLTTLGSTLFMLGGYDSTSLRDVWSTTNGDSWTQVDAQADWSEGRGVSAIAHTDPRDNKKKLFVMGGRDGATYSNEVWISTDGATWEQADDAEWAGRYHANTATNANKLYFYSGLVGASKRNDVHEFNYPTTGSHVDYFTFQESDSTYKVQSDSIKLFDGDDALHFHCVSSQGCYVSKNSNQGGNVLYIKANSTALNPGFTLQTQNLSSITGGESLTNEIIVHMEHSDTVGASYLYMLASDGDLYQVQLETSGDVVATAQVQKVPTGLTPTGTYAFQSARVRLKNQDNDEILITGLADHIVVKRPPRVAKYGCCRW